MEINRRRVLTGTAAAAGATALGFGGYELLRKPGASSDARAGSGERPNILVIVVDQMRAPQWFPDPQQLGTLLPRLDGLRKQSVSFTAHYSASNMCTPSRGVLTTGLYSHQTGCLFTGEGPTESTLAPRFPTWGSMLRDAGYGTWWWGKWHLGHEADNTPDGLDAHGFSGGTYPSPNGAPNQGLQQDPSIVDQFTEWFDDHATVGPWCATVSLVNPHDICWWPKNPLPDGVPHVFSAKPVNFETADDMRRRGKPQLQIDYMNFMSPLMTGALAYDGPESAAQWARCLDMYLWLQQQVDAQIGRVLDVVAARPEIDRNTVVVFTSDHGEYAGSHGLRGKGAAIYEESIRVPLYIRDPSGRLTPAPGAARTQLTSSADIAPLLLTIGHGGNGWRSDSRYSHLAGRADIAAIAATDTSPGRPWVAHATDDMSAEVARGAEDVRQWWSADQHPHFRAQPHRRGAHTRREVRDVLALEVGKHERRSVPADRVRVVRLHNGVRLSRARQSGGPKRQAGSVARPTRPRGTTGVACAVARVPRRGPGTGLGQHEGTVGTARRLAV
jgi:arylsulfatase A-like enzyme